MLSFLFVFAVTLVCAGRADSSGKLPLTLYYESACPDTREFILNQLQPTMQRLQDYISLKLVPFGKARSLKYGHGGFRCQHGAPECLGNLIQDCTLDLMSSRSDMDKVQYLVCEFRFKSSTRGDLKCVVKSNVSPQLVKNCITSTQGVTLQLKSEYLTNMVRPRFIPTVTVNEVFDQNIQDNAIADLTGTLCSLLKDAKPCAEYYNSQALMSIMA